MRADYMAGKRNRFLRTRTGLGGSGDAHYARTNEFEQMREYARDMDRSDAMFGSIVDRAVTNQLQNGFRVEPRTGDLELNTAIKDEFGEWAGDADECDHYEERNFWEQSWSTLRQTYVDGDICAVLTQAGAIQLLESDRLQSPKGRNNNIVHGIELAGRRKVAFWFTKDPGINRISKNRKVQQVLARGADGHRQVLHVYNPNTVKRISQTRGVTAFAPVFYRLGMYEDEQFAILIARQLTAMCAIFLERGSEWKAGTAQFGSRKTEADPNDNSNTRTLEKINPGAIIRGAKGEIAKILSSNVPSVEVQKHLRHVLSEIGVTIGVPLILALMDASETNFSGWRGAVEEAKKAWRINQQWFVNKFARPVYLWKMRQWLDDGVFGSSAASNPLIFKHIWGMPRWPYSIQPLHDAQANALKLSTGQMTPSEFARENSFEWRSHAEELANDWGVAIVAAKKKADEINKEFSDDPVHWRDVLNLVIPKGMTLSGSLDTAEGATNAA